jgi:hypothetical protein
MPNSYLRRIELRLNVEFMSAEAMEKRKVVQAG